MSEMLTPERRAAIEFAVKYRNITDDGYCDVITGLLAHIDTQARELADWDRLRQWVGMNVSVCFAEHYGPSLVDIALAHITACAEEDKENVRELAEREQALAAEQRVTAALESKTWLLLAKVLSYQKHGDGGPCAACGNAARDEIASTIAQARATPDAPQGEPVFGDDLSQPVAALNAEVAAAWGPQGEPPSSANIADIIDNREPSAADIQRAESIARRLTGLQQTCRGLCGAQDGAPCLCPPATEPPPTPDTTLGAQPAPDGVSCQFCCGSGKLGCLNHDVALNEQGQCLPAPCGNCEGTGVTAYAPESTDTVVLTPCPLCAGAGAVNVYIGGEEPGIESCGLCNGTGTTQGASQ